MSWHDRRGGDRTVMSATFMPGDDEFYMPPVAPVLQAPEPQRINPDMSNQIAGGLQQMDLNGSLSAVSRPYSIVPQDNNTTATRPSPFPKLVNPPPNVPPSDEELEARLENARLPVLNSNDPDMQLAWATDALVYCGICTDEAERLAAANPSQARSVTPRIEHQLKQDAMNIVTFLADQHHPRAEFLRGMWLEWGRHGQKEDKKEAFRCYSRAADRGFARAEYRIGMLYESYNDPAKALRHYHRGVDAGDAACCYRLGMMTLRGQHGQQRDFAAGIELIKQSAAAADENAAQGAYVYGMLLARQLPQIEVPDHLLPYDERLAKENIEKAAYMKFAKAQAKMGSMYELGALGCDFNPALSIHYNALASKQGEADADMALSKWFLVGADKIFPKNEELAYTYAERAAQTGLPTAEFALGYFSEIGMHVPVNLERAEKWYEKAAQHGNEDAKGRLEGLAKKHVLSKKDHEDVAISRIKSQHGSMRATQRPDRLRAKHDPSLSQVAEQPSYTSYTSYTSTAAHQIPLPARGTTPYPEDNGPPRIDPRPASVAPYPTEEGPPHIGGGPAGGFFNLQPLAPRPATTVYPHDHRGQTASTPAFTLNPELGMASHASLPPAGSSSYRPMYPNNPNNSAPHLRPATAAPMGYDQRHVSAPILPPHGTPPMHAADSRLRPVPGQRITSGPPSLQPLQSGGGLQPARLRPHSAAAVPDIGFQAPADTRPPVTDPTWNAQKPSRARRNSWVSASQVLGENGPAAASTPNLGSTDGSSRSSKVSSVVSGGSSTTNTSAGSGLSAASGKARVSSGMGGRNPAPVGQKGREKSKERVGSRPGGGTSGAAASTASAGASGGKGPKTFEEMGVPAHNQDKECVIM